MTEPEKEDFVKALGMKVASVSADEVVLEWTVTSSQHQPMGIVHGGVYCSAIETACSIGASRSAGEREAG